MYVLRALLCAFSVRCYVRSPCVVMYVLRVLSRVFSIHPQNERDAQVGRLYVVSPHVVTFVSVRRHVRHGMMARSFPCVVTCVTV